MAHHKPFSKQRWSIAQKHEISNWKATQKEQGNLHQYIEQARQRYLPFITPHCENLQPNSQILELGCGPICIAQEIQHGEKTYLDPLLDDYRRAWPGTLPQGQFITGMAENIDQCNASYDLILGIRLLSYVENPELVLHEVERLLKPNAIFLISIDTCFQTFARLYYYTANVFPMWTLKNRLYCYSQQGIEKSLKRHFHILKKLELPQQSAFNLRQEVFYVCTPLD